MTSHHNLKLDHRHSNSRGTATAIITIVYDFHEISIHKIVEDRHIRSCILLCISADYFNISIGIHSGNVLIAILKEAGDHWRSGNEAHEPRGWLRGGYAEIRCINLHTRWSDQM